MAHLNVFCIVLYCIESNMFVKKKKKKKRSVQQAPKFGAQADPFYKPSFSTFGLDTPTKMKVEYPSPPPPIWDCLSFAIDWGRVRLGCIFYEVKYLGLRTKVLMQCCLKFIRAVLMTWRITFSSSSLETASTPENNFGKKKNNNIIYIIKHEAKFTVKLYRKTPGQIIPFPKLCYTYRNSRMYNIYCQTPYIYFRFLHAPWQMTLH